MTEQTVAGHMGEGARRVPPPYGPIPEGASLGPWSHRPADEAEARALASALRVQILRLTLRNSLTNKEIAERLGRNPATVLHHVRTLLATGFLVPDGERRGARGAREIPYRATGKSWYVTRDVGDRSLLDAFLAEVSRADLRDTRMSRLGLRLSAEHREELERRIGDLLDEFARRPPDSGGEDWSVFVALHPEPAIPASSLR
jgi:DNA-binding transcriptional ArsR family regulator